MNAKELKPMNSANEAIVYGWKFLTPWGSTEGRDMPGTSHKQAQQPATYYPLPQPGQKWGDWLIHPEPVFDGDDRGPGRFHMMNALNAVYAPGNWWVWFARGKGVAGQSDEKTGVIAIQLRRVRPEVFWRIVRLGWCQNANLPRANLYGANLDGANLRGANLDGANLRGARNLDKAFGVASDGHHGD
jgi:hypothetical protein